jgi:hypothetical protein
MRDRPMNCDPPGRPTGAAREFLALRLGSRPRQGASKRGGAGCYEAAAANARVRTASFWVLAYEGQERNDLLLNAEVLTAEHVSFSRRCAPTFSRHRRLLRIGEGRNLHAQSRPGLKGFRALWCGSHSTRTDRNHPSALREISQQLCRGPRQHAACQYGHPAACRSSD